MVREALAKLASEGLVEPRQGAGVFVIEHISTAFGAIASEMGTRDSVALNVLEVRLAIEIESAGLAAVRRNAAQEAALQEAFFEFERLLLNSEPTGSADLAFHRAIASATNNPFYVEMLECSAAPFLATSPHRGRLSSSPTNTSAGCSPSIWSSQRHLGRRRGRRATRCACTRRPASATANAQARQACYSAHSDPPAARLANNASGRTS